MRNRCAHAWLVRCGVVFLVAAIPRASHASWASDGNRVVGPEALPSALSLVSGNGASFLAAWVDGRSGYSTDVRATRWTAEGLPAAGWPDGGTLVTAITCQKFSLVGIPDGAGGALYAWSDNRCLGDRQIHACRMTGAGARAPGWPANGLRIAATGTHQYTPAIAGDGSGGAFVAWQDQRGTDADIYLQHVTGGGAVASGWPVSGLAIATASGNQTAPCVEPDGAGGVYVAWLDRRAGQVDIYLQHVTAGGALWAGWAANGTAVCVAAGDQSGLGMVGDDAGGVFLAWQDPRAGGVDLYALRVRADGAPAAGWTSGGNVVAGAPGEQSGLRLARDDAAGLLLAWQDHRGPDWDVYAARIAANGAPRPGWPTGGLAIATSGADQLAPGIAADGAGGALVAWQSGTPGAFDIHAIRIASNGAVAPGWPTGGTRVCSAPGDQESPLVTAVDGEGFVLWIDRRSGGSASLYAHRLLAGGPIPVRPSGLAALHHDGQTFLTWTPPPDTGWTHRVYVRSSPIDEDSDFALATLLGSVGDSSATDRRLSAVTGTLCTFRTDSAATPLAADRGLFVATVPSNRQAWYAVTSQLRGGPEDRHVVPGGNALTTPVDELLGLPRPVYQGTRSCGGTSQDVYTLWTWPADTPLFPAMSNRPSAPYDCGVTRGASQGPAIVNSHARGGNFAESCLASGSPGEWVLSLDDYTMNHDVCTYYYGYHPGYDMTSNQNEPPVSGQVVAYTSRRMLHTIDWWRRTFDLDVHRLYAFGYSLGGTNSLQLGLAHPERIVAAFSVVAKVDFSFESDPDTNSLFNPGHHFRNSLSRLWGTTAVDLPSSEGAPVYSRVNYGALAETCAGSGSAFLMNFAGRNDPVVGWAEKIGFYAALEANRLGGTQYWDLRDHSSRSIPGAFSPMIDLRYLYRFRSDRSWPAFSNCSTNSEPGDGTAASGDSVGTLNGFMEWVPELLDSTNRWQVILSTRPLSTLWGPLPAPESLTVDVTPRRVQRFRPAPGTPVGWKAVRMSDGIQVQSGFVSADGWGRVTVPAVKTYRTGTQLTLLGPAESLDADREARPAARLELTPRANPLRGRGTFDLVWPRDGRARVELFDLSGRRARTLWDGAVSAGAWSLSSSLEQLPPGLYLVRATLGEHRAIRRIALLR